MSTTGHLLATFLKELIVRRAISASKLASNLGVTHASVSRWLSQDDAPSLKSCQKLAEYSGTPILRILMLAGHLPYLPESGSAEWPEFREYARRKYPEELDEDLIAMIEDLIERRRKRHEGSRDQ